jgi:hypothetical protein
MALRFCYILWWCLNGQNACLLFISASTNSAQAIETLLRSHHYCKLAFNLPPSVVIINLSY